MTLDWLDVTVPLREKGRLNSPLATHAPRRRVYWRNPIFYNVPVCGAQIIQDTLDRVRVRYVPASGFTRNAEQVMATRLQGRMGNVEVTLEPLEKIPRVLNGKFQPVICVLSQSEREQACEVH